MTAFIKTNGHQLHRIASAFFRAYDFTPENADIAAHALIEADVRGVASHGINRLPLYGKMIGRQMIDPAAELSIISQTPAAVHFDANHGLGLAMASKAATIGIGKARDSGICVVGIKNSGHFGMSGYYALQAARENLVALVISNAGPGIVPTGGRERLLGNSPFSIAFPGGERYPEPIMLDMATSVVSFGKIEQALRAGQSIPHGWALNGEGMDTHDPADIIGNVGGLLPFGGAKGYCLTVMLEMMASVLVGASFGADVGTGTFRDAEPKKEKVGHFMLFVNPGFFQPIAEFRKAVDDYAHRIKSSQPAEGIADVLLPGELEARAEQRLQADGIDFNASIAEEILTMLKARDALHERANLDDLLAL